MKRRFATAIILALACSTILVAPALAGKPGREPLPPDSGTVFNLDETYCGFAVDLTITVNKEYLLTFGDGSQIITGKLFANLTNVEEPENSIDINISGPGFSSVDSPVLVLSGASLLWFAEGELGPGTEGFIWLTRGPVVLDFSGDYPTIDPTANGASVRDMCAELAG